MKKQILTTLLFIVLANVGVKAQVGIGVSTANVNPSAQFEVNSTTKGLLPPRMTAVQRNSIATSPSAAGLTIWCSNCGTSGQMQVFNGTAWTDMIGGSALEPTAPELGGYYQGGIVFYILVSGDPGYDANTQHGLIAATSDQSTGIRWFNGSNTVTGARGTAIGTGLSNTDTIIARQGATATSYAAGLARAYTGGGYTDWYLPSKDELNKLYLNRVLVGGFASDFYWSSTESDAFNAQIQNFSNNMQSGYFKLNTFYVRAVRAF
jgi:hypothetical protein